MPRVSQHQATLTKQRIIDAALNIVLNNGLDALTFTNIANKAEIGRSNINNHFKKKHDLIGELRPLLANVIVKPLRFTSTDDFYLSWQQAIKTNREFGHAISVAEPFFSQEQGIAGLKNLFKPGEPNVENTIYMAIGYALVNLPKYLSNYPLEEL